MKPVEEAKSPKDSVNESLPIGAEGVHAGSNSAPLLSTHPESRTPYAVGLHDLLLEFVKRFRIKPSADVCYICKCRYKHAEDCLVRKAEQIL